MKTVKYAGAQNRFLSFFKYGLLACVFALLLSSCQSASSNSSSSSTSSSSTSTASPASQSTSSSVDSVSENSAGQPSSGNEEPEQDSMIDEPPTSSTPSDEILSDGEAVAVLDEQLDESIAVFDSMIINERVAAQATENDLPEDDEPWGDDEPLFEEADISESSDGQEQASSPTTGGDARGDDATSTARGAGDGSIVSRNGVRGNAANNQAPEDVSDGSDDDIVARQIREAALNEKDPVLREKLWEEYRKYKRGQ